MSNKLIDLNALSSYKTQSDLKYQDKLTAGTGINITNNVISATGGGGGATYTAGDGIDISAQNVISVTGALYVVYSITILASMWDNNENSVAVIGTTSSDNFEIIGVDQTGMTDSQIAEAKTALGKITYGNTGNDVITFHSNNPPDIDIPIVIHKIYNTGVVGTSYSAGTGISISNGVISTTWAGGTTEITISLPAANWDSATHLITVPATGVTANSIQRLLPLPATSQANIDNNLNLQYANIFEYSQAIDSITLFAVEVPSSNLTARLLITG